MKISKMFHDQVRDGLMWFHFSEEHQSFSGAMLRRNYIFIEIYNLIEILGQSQSAISIPQLKRLLALHLVPIEQLFFLQPIGNTHLGVCFTLRCFQRLSLPCVATWRLPLER